MFRRRQLTAQLAQELIEAITDSGRRDLTQLSMGELESEVYGLLDQVSQRTMCGVLEEQAEAIETELTHCPQCRRELVDRPPETKTLTGERAELQWQQPVKRCKSCRCDFFPSGPGAGH
jgi:uncharacterized protein with PIN domain